MNNIKATETYQCPGCVVGSDTECGKFLPKFSGCANHVSGTFIFPHNTIIALGLPNGFCRFGSNGKTTFDIHSSYEEMIENAPNLTSIFSLPVWKYLDENSNTIVRYFSPRTNYGWTEVILGDCRDKLPFAHEITASDLKNMD